MADWVIFSLGMFFGGGICVAALLGQIWAERDRRRR